MDDVSAAHAVGEGVADVVELDQRHASTTSAVPWPPPAAIAGQAVPTRRLPDQLGEQPDDEDCPAGSPWVAQGQRAALATDAVRVDAELVVAGEHPGRRRPADLDDVQVVDAQAGIPQGVAHCRDQSDPRAVRVDPDRGRTEHLQARQPGTARGEGDDGGAVVDPARGADGHSSS